MIWDQMPVTEPSRAVFLSYASEDAEAAQRICETLGAAGIEVWFDKSELRGGDAWDQSIRKQIKTCALFLPIISHTTHDRREGYFRLEWKLAIDRCHLMDANLAFLLPVVIDDTRNDDDRVPERFREVQWTRLPGGKTTPAFVKRVQRLLSGDASSAIRTVSSGTLPSGRRASASWSPKRALPVAVALVVLAAMTAYFAIHKTWTSKSAPSTYVTPTAAASIAVLPLANESAEAGQQYFSDGISEDLITALSQLPGLKVIGRTSAFQFRDSKEDSRSIGAKLGVTHLLEGSVRRSGEIVRVSAELIDTADGSAQWSERYDRPYKDLFALQDEITRAVAGALKTKLLSGVHAAAQGEQPPSGDLEAYNALLQGRFYFVRGADADSRKAIEFLTQATQLDPRYALAWSELSRAWLALSGDFLEGKAAQEANEKARDAAERALALSPDLAAAHNARGDLLQLVDFDWRGAEAEYRRALELSPNDAQAQFNLGSALASYGELDQAIWLTRQAIVTDPLRAGGYKALATYLMGLHHFDEAERAINKAIEIAPASAPLRSWLTIIEVQRGNAPAALEAAQQEPPGAFRGMSFAFARQIGGDQSAADSALRTFIEKDADQSAYQIAEVYALRNDAKATLEWLDRAWNNRDSGIQYLLFDPFILRYKDDTRFAAFCRKVGLPVPGEATAHKSISPDVSADVRFSHSEWRVLGMATGRNGIEAWP
jgi:TolB-like protein/Tfp pilus assembly protein PilF